MSTWFFRISIFDLHCHYKKIHNEIPPDFKDQKQYLCDQCPDVFLTKHSLHLHTLRKHPIRADSKDDHHHPSINCLPVTACMHTLNESCHCRCQLSVLTHLLLLCCYWWWTTVHHQKECTKRKTKLRNVHIAKRHFDVIEIVRNMLKLCMTNQLHLNVISVRGNLDWKERYYLINKLFIQKSLVMFADKKFTIRLSSKDIKLQCMALFPQMHFIVKIVLYFFEVKKTWDTTLQTNIKKTRLLFL